MNANMDNVYQVTVEATDATNNVGRLDVTITVTNVDETPEVAGTASLDYPENGRDPVGVYTATDPEQAILTWGLSGDDGGKFSISAGGELNFKAPPNYEAPVNSNVNNVDQLTISSFDGTNTGVIDVTITVTNVDETPAVSGSARVSYLENGTGPVSTYRATDPEGAATAWSLSGEDRDDFSIDDSGVLTFNAAPDYEAPLDANRNNVYRVRVEASDATNNTGGLNVAVTVTNASEGRPRRSGGGGGGGGGGGAIAVPPNRPPVLTAGERVVLSVAENAAIGDNIGAPVQADDPDRDTLAYSLSGPDSAAIEIGPTSGQLRLKAALDYEAKSTYTLTVTVSDGRGGSDSLALTIMVTDVPELPPTPLSSVVIDNLETQAVGVVKPEGETVVSAPNTGAVVTFPARSRAVPYQVRVDTNPRNCGEESPGGDVRVCLRVDIFDALGNPEVGVQLDQPATIEIELDSDALGGLDAVLTAHARGGVSVYTRRGPDDDWAPVEFTLERNAMGVIAITVSGILSFSEFAVATDREVFQRVVVPSAPPLTPLPITQPAPTSEAPPVSEAIPVAPARPPRPATSCFGACQRPTLAHAHPVGFADYSDGGSHDRA